MTPAFPEPTLALPARAEVFLSYLDYFRASMVGKVRALADSERRSSRLPSGWTPLELLNHLRHVELRWIEWGFEGGQVAEPWGDLQGDRWHVPPGESLDDLVAALDAQAAHTRAVVESADLDTLGQPGPRWDGAPPASLERVLFHLVQEYARHLGHLDIVVELAGVPVGE